MKVPPKSYAIGPEGAWIRCLLCDRTSHNQNDVAKLYCGNCHLFHADPNWAMGAEYSLSELARLPEKTVVFLHADHAPHIAVTAWFVKMESGTLELYAGEINLTLVLFQTAEGVVDGQNRRIHVHRYLGEV